MILAIDAGNTHIVLGCFGEDGSLLPTLRIPTLKNETEYGYASKIKEVLSIGNITVEDVKGAIICSSVPEINRSLFKAIKLICNIDSLIVGPEIKTDLKVTLTDPANIGADLIATAVAAKKDYSLPAIIIDLGTATTITVVNENEEFIGGAILPGVRISQDALANRTSLLPHIDIKPPKHVISLDTISCIQSGAVYGTAGSIDGMIDRMIEEMPVKPASILATGGLGDMIIPYCKHEIKYDANLLLRGLEYIWKINN